MKLCIECKHCRFNAHTGYMCQRVKHRPINPVTGDKLSLTCWDERVSLGTYGCGKYGAHYERTDNGQLRLSTD